MHLPAIFSFREKANPGQRIRICLNRPEVFHTQLRALYRAFAFGKVVIMFPMIASVWEVRECKRACQKVMAELDEEGVPYNKDTEIGICGELGADLELLETFLAIGIDELPVSPTSVLPLRAEIRKSIAKICTLEKLEC